MKNVPSGHWTSQDILPASLAAQSVVKTESSPSIVAKSLHSPAGGFSPVGLSPVGLPPVGLSPFGLSGLSPVGLSPFGLSGLPPVGLPPDGLSGFPISGQPSSGHASHVPSSLLKAKVPSSFFMHLLLADPLTMKPSPHLSIHWSFLHLTLPFSTAAGSSHLVHLPSSPKTGGLSPVGLSPVGLPPVGLSPVGLSPVGLPPDGLSGLPPVGLPPDGLSGFSISGQPSSGHATQAPSSLLNAKVSSSPFTHLDLPAPSSMKPSSHLTMQVSFLHRTLPLSTAAGSSHSVHFPSSPATAGFSAVSLAKAKAKSVIPNFISIGFPH